MPVAEDAADVEVSRKRLLDAIPDGADVTFIRGAGNIGDHLIWAGTRQLLASVEHREITTEELPEVRGDVAILSGGGGFCRAFHEEMPFALRLAEERFSHVVVLPSSFEVEEDVVRRVLSASRATVFAREPVSHAAIGDLCDAHLALDCAFFLDYGPYRVDGDGDGVLDAFRDDPERRGDSTIPEGNDDLSVTAPDLDAFLSRIARASLVRTDRAHVTISGALLGRPVQYGASSYHKVPAIAEWALARYPVTPLPAAAAASPRGSARRGRGRFGIGWWSRGARRPDWTGQVTTVVPAREHAGGDAVAAARSAAGTRVLLVDRSSSPGRVAGLRDAGAGEVIPLDHDPGPDGAVTRVLDRVSTPFTLVLPPGAVLAEDATASLLATLDAHADAAAATAEPRAAMVELDAGAATVVPAGAALWRTDRLRQTPADPDLGPFAGQEQVLRAPAGFVAAPAGLVARTAEPATPASSLFVERLRHLEAAERLARIHARHGLVLTDLYERFPWMAGDVRSARLLFALIEGKGLPWVLSAWYSADLVPLFRGPLPTA